MKLYSWEKNFAALIKGKSYDCIFIPFFFFFFSNETIKRKSTIFYRGQVNLKDSAKILNSVVRLTTLCALLGSIFFWHLVKNPFCEKKKQFSKPTRVFFVKFPIRVYWTSDLFLSFFFSFLLSSCFCALFLHSENVCEKKREDATTRFLGCTAAEVIFPDLYSTDDTEKYEPARYLPRRKHDHTVTSPGPNICPLLKNGILQFFVSPSCRVLLSVSFLPSFGDNLKNVGENAAFPSSTSSQPLPLQQELFF